jgi:Flp pilus assembly protein TadD
MLDARRSRVRHCWLGTLAAIAMVLGWTACSAPAPTPAGGAGSETASTGGAKSGGASSGSAKTGGDAAKPASRGTRTPGPSSVQGRLELADRYYEEARKALDEGKQEEYLALLRKAQAEIIEATRIDPTDPQPHTQMGIITAYLGDLDAAESSFRNALRLSQRDRRRQPGGTLYSNVAHIAVYQGKLKEARRFLERAIRTGAPDDEIARISVLLSWAQNDMVEARDQFENAVITSKQFAETWDGAPLPKPMKNFSDFAGACCLNPTCGPHMANACAREKQSVAQREITLETVRQEMEMERERRAKLKDIYERRKDLEISVEDPNAPAKRPDGAPGSGAAPSAPGKAPATAPAPGQPKAAPAR